MEKVIIIEGMSCNHCKNAVEKAAMAVPGVGGAEVFLERKELKLRLNDAGESTIEAVETALLEAGYEPKRSVKT